MTNLQSQDAVESARRFMEHHRLDAHAATFGIGTDGTIYIYLHKRLYRSLPSEWEGHTVNVAYVGKIKPAIES